MDRATFTVIVFIVGICGGLAILNPNDGPDFSQATLQRRAKELRPILEAIHGEAFGPVEVRRVTRKEIALLMYDEFYDMGMASDGPRGKALRAIARSQSQAAASAVLGKVDIRRGTVFIVPENFVEIDAMFPGVYSDDMRDAVLLHEMVHVMQVRAQDLFRFYTAASAGEEFVARAAVVEGHAQYLAARAASKAGPAIDRAFRRFSDIQSKAPKSIDNAAARSLIEGLQAMSSFPYASGRMFVERVIGRLGYRAGVKHLFAHPPESIEAITSDGLYMPDVSNLVRAHKRIHRWLGDTQSDLTHTRISSGALPQHVYQIGGGALRLSLSDDSGLTVAWDESPRDEPFGTRVLSCAQALLAGVITPAPWAGRKGDFALAAFVEALTQPDWALRWRAARNLGRLSDREGILPALRTARGDADPRVRVAAVRSMIRRGVFAQEDIAATKNDADWEVRAVVAAFKKSTAKD